MLRQGGSPDSPLGYQQDFASARQKRRKAVECSAWNASQSKGAERDKTSKCALMAGIVLAGCACLKLHVLHEVLDKRGRSADRGDKSLNKGILCMGEKTAFQKKASQKNSIFFK